MSPSHVPDSLLHLLEEPWGVFPPKNYEESVQLGDKFNSTVGYPHSSALTFWPLDVPLFSISAYHGVVPPPISEPPEVDGSDYFAEALSSLFVKESQQGVIPTNAHLKDKRTGQLNLYYRSCAMEIIFRLFSVIPSVNENVVPLAVNMLDRVMSEEGGALAVLWVDAALLAAVCFKLAYCVENDGIYAIEYFPRVFGIPRFCNEQFCWVERRVLAALDYNLNSYPPVFQFATVIMDDGREYGVYFRQVVSYLLNICSMDHRFVGQLPSKMAAGAVYLALKIVPMDCSVSHWDEGLVCTSGGYTKESLQDVLEMMLDKFSRPLSPEAFHYYASDLRLQVSILVNDWMGCLLLQACQAGLK